MPDEYSAFCGPAVFSSVTGCRREDAYKTLAYWKERGGWPPMPSTPPNILAAALLSRHYPLERWSIRPGEPLITRTADATRKHVFQMLRRDRQQWDRILEMLAEHHDAQREPQPEAVQQALEDCRGVRGARAERARIEPYGIGEWLRRRPVGTWILFSDGHVSAARAGRLITDEHPLIHTTPLTDAWRVGRREI